MSITTIVPVSPIVNIDVSVASKVIVLPAASTCIGTTFFFKDYKGGASTNNIFISTNGLDRVDGQSLSSVQLRLRSTLEIMKVMSLGNTSWSVIQRNKVLPSIFVFDLPTTITFLSFAWQGGGRGSTTAQPTWNWSFSGGRFSSYTLELYADTNNPPTTLVTGTTAPSGSATTYTFPGATVENYYYKLVLTGINGVSSSGFTNIQYNLLTATNITLTSFSWGGTEGSTTAQPTWNWTNSGGAISSYTMVLYADTNNPPSTIVSGTTTPSASATSYTYPGSTVLGYYYMLYIRANNATGNSSITDSRRNGVPPPNLSLASFSFAGGFGTDAQPTWTWTNSGGDIVSYTLYIYSDTNNPPTTEVESATPDSSTLSYVYDNPTTADNFYKIAVTATNAVGSSTLTDVRFNGLGAPSLELTYSFFNNGAGNTYPTPLWIWNNNGGTPTTLTAYIYADVNNPPTTLVNTDSVTPTDNYYVYYNEIAIGYYVRLRLVAVNSFGNSEINNTMYNGIE